MEEVSKMEIVLMKTCTKCGIEKPLTEFYKQKGGVFGVHSQCKCCIKAIRKKHYSENSDDIKITVAKYKELHEDYYSEYRELHKEEHRQFDKIYRATHVQEMIDYRKDYNSRVTTKLKNALRKRKRVQTDTLFKLSCNMRTSVGNAMFRGGYAKTSHTHEILGCTYEEFMVYIENQFADGMSWDNYPEWEYDHIYPISLAIDEEHLIALNHYTNFQPLWREDNRRKSNKLPEDFE
jgi:hypothetical protein